MIYQFLALLAVHWIADFVLQTHWQASNKSKNLEALCRHVSTYTATMAVAAPFIFGIGAPLNLLGFVLLNNFLHLATDYCTSRWSARLFGPAVSDLHKVMSYTESYGHPPDEANMRIMEIDPARHFHNFFVVIGLDQLIHQVTLAGTMLLFFGGAS